MSKNRSPGWAPATRTTRDSAPPAGTRTRAPADSRYVLQARLLVHAGQRGVGHVRHLRQWLLQRGERGHGPDAAGSQAASLVRAQRCDQAQVIRASRQPSQVSCQRRTSQWRTGSGVSGSGKTGHPRAASRKRPSRCGSRRGSRPGDGCRLVAAAAQRHVHLGGHRPGWRRPGRVRTSAAAPPLTRRASLVSATS